MIIINQSIVSIMTTLVATTNCNLKIILFVVTIGWFTSKATALSNYHYPRKEGLHEQLFSQRRRFAISSIATSFTSFFLLPPSPITKKPCHAENLLQPESPQDATKIQSEKLKQIYDQQASTYETLYSESLISKKLDFDTLRQDLLSNAKGNVLELGVGTGLNLPHYSNNNAITSYTAIDISSNMLDQAKLRFEKSNNRNNNNVGLVSQSLQNLYNQNKVSFQIADVQELTSIRLPDYMYSKNNNTIMKFDTIIDTFGLCVFPNPQNVILQAKELLSSNNGQLLLLEHQDSVIGKILSPTRKLSDVSNTCRYDDNVKRIVNTAGFHNIQYYDLAGGFLVSVIATK